MNRNQVLGEAGKESNGEAEKDLLCADSLCNLAGCNISQPGAANGNGQDSQQNVAQSRFRVSPHPSNKGAECLGKIHAARQSSNDTGNQDGQQYVHFHQAEGRHDNNRYDNWVGQNIHVILNSFSFWFFRTNQIIGKLPAQLPVNLRFHFSQCLTKKRQKDFCCQLFFFSAKSRIFLTKDNDIPR